jgi:histidine triad (HIT) family protein
MPAEVAAALAARLPALGKALREVTKAAGFNLLANEGAVAGQEVEHVHFHLIPRKANDGLGYRWKPGEYPEGRAEELRQSLQQALAAR